MSKSEVPSEGDFVEIEYSDGESFDPDEADVAAGIVTEVFDEEEIVIYDSGESVVLQNRYKDSTVLRKDPYGKDEFLGTASDWHYY